MTNQKENLINELTIQLAQSDMSITTIKRTVEMVLYHYDVQKIGNTELSVGDSSTTEQLLSYFRISKLGSNKGENTLYQYELSARQLCDFVHKELNMISGDDVKFFLIGYKMQHKVSDVTMNNKRRNLSSVFGYLYKTKKISENPMDYVDVIKCQSKVKKPLDESEIEHIIMATENSRDLAIVYFLLSTGVRVSELCGIKLSDVNFNERSAIVLGKGNKEREVYFDKKTLTRLEIYLQTRKDINYVNGRMVYPENSPLFSSLIGKCNKLKPSAIQEVIKKIGQKSGITRIHPHLFRATYATRLAEKGTPLTVIAKALGHADLDTVQKYVLMSDSEIRRILKTA